MGPWGAGVEDGTASHLRADAGLFGVVGWVLDGIDQREAGVLLWDVNLRRTQSGFTAFIDDITYLIT
jgi:hypothetical protein